MKLKHGQKVKCKIRGVQIDDAKISVNDNGSMYICHNDSRCSGMPAKDKLGYRCSWTIGDDWQEGVEDVTNIRPAEGFYPQKGDVLVKRDKECIVFETLGDLVFCSVEKKSSRYWNTITFGGPCHRLELERAGWKIKDQEPDKVEVTMDEIAKWKGVNVKKLRVKKEGG